MIQERKNTIVVDIYKLLLVRRHLLINDHTPAERRLRHLLPNKWSIRFRNMIG